MTKPGRRPAPTALKVLRGETKASRLNHDAPVPRASRPRMPPDMTKEAQAVWRHVIREMGATGIIRAVHSESLRVYCDAVARYARASRLLDESGLLLPGQKGELVKNPMHQVVRDNAVLMRDFARELGLTPSAAEALHAPLHGAGSEDDAEAWMRRYAGNAG
jgi:P27 family predicted phage terminase small subunit